MKTRALLLSLFAFAAFAPSANAAVADSILPVYDAADGVRLVHSATGEPKIRFDAKAAKLYKTIAGKRAEVGCGTVTPEPLGDGPLSTTGYGSNPDVKLSKKRGTVRTWTSDANVELCSIATKRTKKDVRCLPLDSRAKLCVRVVVAASPSGAAYLDQRARSIELSLTSLAVGLALTPDFIKLPGVTTTLGKVQAVLGPDVVELTTPDDSPPAGKVGYWTDGKNLAVVVLLADGKRRFARIQDEVFSTNDMALSGLDNDEIFALY